MSFGLDVENIAEALIDLHVGLTRAHHLASELRGEVSHEGSFVKLYEELDQMRRDVERLMKEVV